MTRSLPLTLDTSSAVLMVRGTTQPAIPKSHEEESERADQQQRIDNDADEVIHQHQDHDHHLHPQGEASDDNIPEINRQDAAAEKPYSSDRDAEHHTKINSILRNELLDQLHQQRQAGMVHQRTTERGGGRQQGAMGDELLTLYSSRKEITMGICAAFSVFLIIVMVFVVRLHRTRQPVDKETLIDNEADVGFLPPPSNFSDSQSQTTVHV